MTSLTLFTQARLKLTFYYILIFMTLSGIISGLFYYRTSQVLEAEYNRMEQRFQLEINSLIPHGPRMILRKIQSEDLAIARKKIIFQLASINGVILALVAASGYILSGLTLAPIEDSMTRQKRFISDIAHEIKTPLTALRTSLEVNLMDKKLTPSIKSLLSENLDDVTHLDQLTTSMLKLSKNQDQPLDSTPVLVDQIIDQAIHLVKSSAKAKHIKLIVKPISNQAIIFGDKASLADVIKILLDNAIKFSPENTTITVSVLNHSQTIDIKVRDQGYGIAADDLEHIFDRFYRVDSARTKQTTTSGYGLGLSIAKNIVEYHQGHLSVASTQGKGSVFTLTFPRISQ